MASSSWKASHSFCNWHGVACGRKHGRVTVLNLISQGLSGTLSPHIGNLSFLQKIDIGNNSFHSGIPTEISSLRSLRIIYLNDNSFSGNVHSNLSACSKLISIDFSVNSLGGHLPADLGTLSMLVYANFGLNHVTGNIPASIGNLSFLEYFSVTRANMEGELPDLMGKLENLAYLAFSNNHLIGSIPSSIFNISSLQVLFLDQNDFEGSLPGDLWDTLPYLRVLNLNYNRFQGFIPMSISNATYLVDFEITSNSITGAVPSLAKSRELMRFVVDGNLLGENWSRDLNFLCMVILAWLDSCLMQCEQISSIGVKGSFGYIAPEYGAGATYGDVYSFGILILETFTGKRPTDDMFKDGKSLYSTARDALERDSIKDIIDPSLLDDMEELGDLMGNMHKRGRNIIFIILEC